MRFGEGNDLLCDPFGRVFLRQLKNVGMQALQPFIILYQIQCGRDQLVGCVGIADEDYESRTTAIGVGPSRSAPERGPRSSASLSLA